MKYIYLGAFPPPYGGVTIKNKLLFNKLFDYIEVEQSKFYDKNNNLLLRIISLFTTIIKKKHGLIIGISKNSLKKLTFVLFFMNKKIMNNSIVLVMGGTFPQMVIKDKRLQRLLQEYKRIYVETDGMQKALSSVGVNNVSVFPNCRERADINAEMQKDNQQLRCLFFSLISEDKGADNIFAAAAILNQKDIDYSIDFYGHIAPKYIQKFESSITRNVNLHYCGVFKSTKKNELYNKLQQYDLLLFPTKWKNEGVPGVLVESKIAGIPAIVSDINFNSEIIKDEKTGLVLKKNTPEELAYAIERVYFNRDWLIELKHNAKDSSEEYLIENYIEDIIRLLKE